jgi:hypothetical protein
LPHLPLPLQKEEVFAAVRLFKDAHPDLGHVQIASLLDLSGVRYSKYFVQEAMREFDAAGVAVRSVRAIKRRRYTVTAPRAVLHYDTHHKLRFWKWVVTLGIDGGTRMIVWADVRDNNSACGPFLGAFSAFQRFGYWRVLRCDYGTENNDVERLVEVMAEDGVDIKHVRGPSVHNQRIERLWVDIREIQTVANSFLQPLVCARLLNMLDPVDRFVMDFIYRPYMRDYVQDFVRRWNNHKLRTAGSECGRL